MNLEDIQPHVVNWLKADPVLGAVPVLADDGSYPKTPEREAALAGKGLVLIVWQVASEGITDMTRDGVIFHQAGVHVLVEENQAVCRAAGGAGIPAEKAVRLVMERMNGAPPGRAGHRPFLSLDPPFVSFGKINGVNHWVVSFLSVMRTPGGTASPP